MGGVKRGLGAYRNLPTAQCTVGVPCPPGEHPPSWEHLWAEMVVHSGDGRIWLPGGLGWSSREQAHAPGENWSRQDWPVGSVLGKVRPKRGPGQADSCRPHPCAGGQSPGWVYYVYQTGLAQRGTTEVLWKPEQGQAHPGLAVGAGQRPPEPPSCRPHTITLQTQP